MELNGWTSPQMLTRYGASARRSYDRIMHDTPLTRAMTASGNSRAGIGPRAGPDAGSRRLGCFAGWRSPRRVTGSGSEAGVPFNRKRGSLFDQGNHAALRTRWPSGRLKPMDNA